MRRFRYIARLKGLEERGIITASTRTEAARQLQNAGYDHVRVKPAESTTGQLFRKLFPSIS